MQSCVSAIGGGRGFFDAAESAKWLSSGWRIARETERASCCVRCDDPDSSALFLWIGEAAAEDAEGDGQDAGHSKVIQSWVPFLDSLTYYAIFHLENINKRSQLDKKPSESTIEVKAEEVK